MEKKLVELFQQLKRSAIEMSFYKEKYRLPATASKFGGNPWLPKDFVWPYFEGTTIGTNELANRPLTFLLQINLEEVAAYDEEHLLPAKGMLYFFYEYATMKWGYDPKDKGCARVYYYDTAPGDLVETLPPADFHDLVFDEEDDFPEFAVKFQKKFMVPDEYEFVEYYSDCGYVENEDYDEYQKAYEVITGTAIDDEANDSIHLLGYANIIQLNMLNECEYVTRGYYLGGGNLELSEAEKAELFEASKDWTLLLQLPGFSDDDEDFYVEWCGGYLYFYIKKEDLRNKNFDNIWLILQCD